MTKLCRMCNKEKDVQEYGSNRGRPDGLAVYCQPCTLAYQRKWKDKNKITINEKIRQRRKQDPEWREKENQRVRQLHANARLEALRYYSDGEPQCKCCQENILAFLSIDHIDGGGNAHRKEIRKTHIHSWLKARGFPDGYQVLCHNCNQAKGYYGICPHQSMRESGTRI